MENHIIIANGFRSLLTALAPYIARELQVAYGNDWWGIGVLDKLYDDQKRDLPYGGKWGELVDALDIQRCLLLFDLHWSTVFKKKLSIDHRTWAKELVGVRNRLAHIGGQDFKDEDTWRALDTMSRLCEQLDADSTEEIRKLLREARYGSADGSTTVVQARPVATARSNANAGVLSEPPSQGLPSWRDVIEPHPDVAQGRYRNAEFAADLAQVARGQGSPEYLDPVEFFARTYVTEGLSGLLKQALLRVTGKGGEPVIQLKTAFGGGKTHSMLALYHMLRGQVSMARVPALKPLMDSVGLSSLPKAHVAVLVGTALDVTKPRKPIKYPGITINTLWGEMAAQLAESAGRPELYDFVKEADKKGVSPGSEVLTKLFDACGPCLVLMDELVSYAKRIYGVSGLPAGSFDNFISFIQQMTEAITASKNSIVVASIPESVIEVGGEAGQITLEMIEKHYGRMEAIWKPVAANEGFEVVRRRLFLDCKNLAGRELVCSKFSQMYNENPSDFPTEARGLEYKERLVSSYPIHPEVFDRLYGDWATLERFQRTRGVLRLMAAVIHELWMSNDAGLMIMPGSLPMDSPNVRDELTRHLPEGWNALVDREVDGRNSVPYQADQAAPRYGRKLAARRVARAILLGSAPTTRDQAVRGIETSRIRLGVVQPGENIADFNDVRNTLQHSLAYLYTNPSNDRYWYDTRPTLRKTMEDRATQLAATDVEFEIERRLKAIRKEPPFAGVHSCPSTSLDVSDDQVVRLVILRPDHEYKATVHSCAALVAANDILNNRGLSPRIYRNMLAFLAPDQDNMAHLKLAVRQHLAWQSIKNDSEDLNLDAAQNRETDNNLVRSNEAVEVKLKETYNWLMVPSIDRSVSMSEIQWDITRLGGGAETLVSKAAKKMQQSESLIVKWAPALLLMELDSVLWKNEDNISIKKLWEYLSTYCYLPRLANYEVLEEAIRNGINSTDYFAYAAGVSADRYLELKYNQYVGIIDKSGYLVKIVTTLKQIAQTQAIAGSGPVAAPVGEGIKQASGGSTATILVTATGGGVALIPQNTRFFLSAQLDTTRINRDVQRLVEEVISHLSAVDGVKLEVTLEVTATATEGMPQVTVRTVSENCRTLKVKSFGFEG